MKKWIFEFQSTVGTVPLAQEKYSPICSPAESFLSSCSLYFLHKDIILHFGRGTFWPSYQGLDDKIDTPHLYYILNM